MSDKKGTMWGPVGQDSQDTFMFQFEKSRDPNSIYSSVDGIDEEIPSQFFSVKKEYSKPEKFFNKEKEVDSVEGN
tara:strand:+ start:852 stop:1076 length:225 start_codon:yes stop_codon:yes gene_type:complete